MFAKSCIEASGAQREGQSKIPGLFSFSECNLGKNVLMIIEVTKTITLGSHTMRLSSMAIDVEYFVGKKSQFLKKKSYFKGENYPH